MLSKIQMIHCITINLSGERPYTMAESPHHVPYQTQIGCREKVVGSSTLKMGRNTLNFLFKKSLYSLDKT